LAAQAEPGASDVSDGGEGEFDGVLEGVLEAEPPAGGVVEVAVEVAGCDAAPAAADAVPMKDALTPRERVPGGEPDMVIVAVKDTLSVGDGVTLLLPEGEPDREPVLLGVTVSDGDAEAEVHALGERDKDAEPVGHTLIVPVAQLLIDPVSVGLTDTAEHEVALVVIVGDIDGELEIVAVAEPECVSDGEAVLLRELSGADADPPKLALGRRDGESEPVRHTLTEPVALPD